MGVGTGVLVESACIRPEMTLNQVPIPQSHEMNRVGLNAGIPSSNAQARTATPSLPKKFPLLRPNNQLQLRGSLLPSLARFPVWRIVSIKYHNHRFFRFF